MGKDNSVPEKQALLSKKRATEDELANINAKLVAIDAIEEKDDGGAKKRHFVGDLLKAWIWLRKSQS
jgi:hypothetical protein